MTERMRQVLDALARLEARGKVPAPAADIAWEAGFRTGQDARRSARDGRTMSPAQRVIFPLHALSAGELVALGRRRDGLSGTAYVLTDAGRQARNDGA